MKQVETPRNYILRRGIVALKEIPFGWSRKAKDIKKKRAVKVHRRENEIE
jgi:hypothetical protein